MHTNVGARGLSTSVPVHPACNRSYVVVLRTSPRACACLPPHTSLFTVLVYLAIIREDVACLRATDSHGQDHALSADLRIRTPCSLLWIHTLHAIETDSSPVAAIPTPAKMDFTRVVV